MEPVPSPPRRTPRTARRPHRALIVLLATITLGSAACGSLDPAPTAAPTGDAPAVTGAASPSGDAAASSPGAQATADPTPASSPDVPASLASGFRVHAYPVVDLAIADRAYAETSDAPLKIDYPADKRGVPRYARNGRTYLHPVSAAQQGLRQLATYVRTGTGAYLDRARIIADALIAAGVKSNGALWIPYRFDFRLHGLVKDTMRAPWYSAMAQGQVLSLVSRLYEITGDQRYLKDAKAVFASFEVVGRRAAPWIVWVESRYLWLEEYPGRPPDHTLNGFIFALYGIYDYYEVTRGASSERVFQAGLTTLAHYLPQFRNKGGISSYCLLHRELSEKYHHIHIGQLRNLTRMTGDPRFAAVADRFEADHH